MGRKNFKRGQSNSFVMIDEWLMSSQAWGSLKPGPRALYLELKRLYNGNNNGRIFLSQRHASDRLNIGRDTVSRYFSELLVKGFLIEISGHCLGSDGYGKAAHYALTELPLNEKPATKDFMKWKKTKSPQENPTRVVVKSNHPYRKIQPPSEDVLENTTAFCQKQPIPLLDNPTIYTSNHMPTEKTVPNLSRNYLDLVRADNWLCPIIEKQLAA